MKSANRSGTPVRITQCRFLELGPERIDSPNFAEKAPTLRDAVKSVYMQLRQSVGSAQCRFVVVQISELVGLDGEAFGWPACGWPELKKFQAL